MMVMAWWSQCNAARHAGISLRPRSRSLKPCVHSMILTVCLQQELLTVCSFSHAQVTAPPAQHARRLVNQIVGLEQRISSSERVSGFCDIPRVSEIARKVKFFA